MTEKLKDRVALVTGSGRHRLGNVIAQALADDGWRLAIHYHASDDEAQETLEQLRSQGCEAEAYRADVGDEGEVERMFDQVLKRFGRLDALVTTASIWKAIPLEKVTADDALASFRVDALGVFLCARRAGLIMAKQPEGGAIVTIGDASIERPMRDHLAYYLAKGAVPTITRALAVELAARNPKVRVNCIHPGPVMFPPDMPEEERERNRQATVLKIANQPEWVADAVKFLIGNRFLTGVCLPVDAGRLIT